LREFPLKQMRSIFILGLSLTIADINFGVYEVILLFGKSETCYQ